MFGPCCSGNKGGKVEERLRGYIWRAYAARV